jgi:uncharacterized phiE125 gp8 family phage protein
MALTRVTAPASIVTLAEAKAHLRVDGTDEDTLITALIAAATAHLDGADGILGRALATQTWELAADAFPDDGGPIRLPLPPLRSVISVTYRDPDGVSQVMPAQDMQVDTRSQPGWIAPVDTWPDTDDTINAVIIRFEAGYGDASAVPGPIKAALLLMIGDLYRFRETATMGAGSHEMRPSASAAALLSPYRIVTF